MVYLRWKENLRQASAAQPLLEKHMHKKEEWEAASWEAIQKIDTKRRTEFDIEEKEMERMYQAGRRSRHNRRGSRSVVDMKQ
jgi:hypothetical protein